MRARSCLILGVVAFCCPVSAQLKGTTYTNQDLAVTVRVPTGWTEIPLLVEEEWVVAKFLSDKSYLSKDREWNWEHKPLMRMIVFTDEARRKGGWEKSEEYADPFARWRDVPYQGYEDFLKRNVKGYFISEEEKAKVGDIDCTMYEVKIHKATPKLRLITWVFRAHAMDIAVEFEMLEDRYDKISGLARRALKSFRFLAGAEVADAGSVRKKSTGRAEWVRDYKAWRKRTATERFKTRRETEAARMKLVREKTLDTWNVAESKSFLVISHGNKRFIEKSTQAADAFRAWCEKQFGKLSDEYVRKGVLRVCQDPDEYMAYNWRKSGGSYSYTLLGENHEVVTYWDSYNGTSGADAGFMFNTIFDGFIQDKDRDVYLYMPLWMKLGCYGYFSNTALKGQKLEFRHDDYMRQQVRDAARNGTIHTFQQLVSMREEEIIASLSSYEDYFSIRAQFTAAVRFVFEEGKRHKPLKGLVLRYMGLVSEIARARSESRRKDSSGIMKTARTEEEEEQQRKARNQRWDSERDEVLKGVTPLAFDLNAKEWARIEKAFTKFIH